MMKKKKREKRKLYKSTCVLLDYAGTWENFSTVEKNTEISLSSIMKLLREKQTEGPKLRYVLTSDSGFQLIVEK